MDFSTDYIHQLGKRSECVLDSVVNLVGCVSLSSLRKEDLLLARNEDLSGTILSLVSVLRDCASVFRSSTVTIETLINDKISNQNKVMKLQEELIALKNEQLKSVSNTSNSKRTEEPLAESEHRPREEERQNNIIIFGMPENEEDSLSF